MASASAARQAGAMGRRRAAAQIASGAAAIGPQNSHAPAAPSRPPRTSSHAHHAAHAIPFPMPSPSLFWTATSAVGR